jgi:hypothetical protein
MAERTDEPAPPRDPDRAVDPVHVAVLAICALAFAAITWHYLAT